MQMKAKYRNKNEPAGKTCLRFLADNGDPVMVVAKTFSGSCNLHLPLILLYLFSLSVYYNTHQQQVTPQIYC
jgi:hypothetical protein